MVQRQNSSLDFWSIQRSWFTTGLKLLSDVGRFRTWMLAVDTIVCTQSYWIYLLVPMTVQVQIYNVVLFRIFAWWDSSIGNAKQSHLKIGNCYMERSNPKFDVQNWTWTTSVSILKIADSFTWFRCTKIKRSTMLLPQVIRLKRQRSAHGYFVRNSGAHSRVPFLDSLVWFSYSCANLNCQQAGPDFSIKMWTVTANK